MYKVSYATGSRADYGIVRKYLHLMESDSEIDLSILVTGTHLEREYGNTKELIDEDGYRISLEVPLKLSENPIVTTSVAKTIYEFGNYFSEIKPDLLIVLGDRYEMFGVTIAAALNKIKILHIHGGESTFGNYDEFIRHSMTKMSMYHIVSTEKYRQRVIQLGESPNRVFNLGALGAENCKYIDLNNVEKSILELQNKKYFVILFHPETLTQISIEDQIKTLLKAIEQFRNYLFVFVGSNADTGSYTIRETIKKYVGGNINSIYFENVNPDSYHFLVKNAKCLIGNSSSGIIEAPSLGTYTINIGDRQKGREKGNSVIDVRCIASEIVNAIKTVEKIDNSSYEIIINNPYETRDTANLYLKKTKDILKRRDTLSKEFWDL